MDRWQNMFRSKKPLIGMIHLPALPGYPSFSGMAGLINHVEEEVELLEELGFDGILIENENDVPHQVLSTCETTAAMAVLTRCAVKKARSIVIGCEILLNDPKASLAAALAGGASFIRTDYFVDRMQRPEHGGEMHIDPPGLLAYRSHIKADHIAILADIQVKYAQMIEPRPIGDSAALARENGADAVIVSGNFTGEAPDLDDLLRSSEAVPGYPVLIGSGLNPGNAERVLPIVGGAIVGTGIMSLGRISSTPASELIRIRDSLLS